MNVNSLKASLFFVIVGFGVLGAQAFAQDPFVPDGGAVAAPAADITREEAARAIINYDAKARYQDYLLQEEKRFMGSPGTHDAIEGGKAAGESSGADARNITNAAMRRGLPTGGPTGIGPQAELFQKVQEYFRTGDPTDLAGLNMTNLIQQTRIDPAVANQLIDILTNPFPAPLQMDILRGDGLSPSDKEFLAERVVEQAMLSVPINALGEMVARRTAQGDEKSLMQVMKAQSTFRFVTPEWYGQLGVSSNEAILREIAQMEAFGLWMNYQNFRVNEQIASLLSVMVASQAKLATTMNKLGEVMATASTQVKDISSEFEDIDFDKQ